MKILRVQPSGKSGLARENRMRRARTFRMTNGRCFYCGGPLLHKGFTDTRDWLFVRPHQRRMVQEHMTPVSRAGTDTRDNYVPACAACNNDKGSFTLKEYRFVCGLRRGDLGFRFAFEAPVEFPRDWLCVHSAEREQALVIHNLPSARDGYDLRLRSAHGVLSEPRVRPVVE